MGNKLYVGNLNYSVTNEELEGLFASHGTVVSAAVIEGKGFGFVEMGDDEQANAAKEALNGSEFKGRGLRIDEAKPRKRFNERRGGSFGGNRYGNRY